jgi:hypothetical protein
LLVRFAGCEILRQIQEAARSASPDQASATSATASAKAFSAS